MSRLDEMSSISTADYLRMQARLHPRADWSGVMDSGPAKESVLHHQIIDECKSRGWIALHGSMVQATARTIGEWDFTILADNGRLFFIECKTGKGKLSPEQIGMIAWAAKLGHGVHVVRSLEEFINIVNRKD